MAKEYAQHLSKGGELLRAEKLDEARSELEKADQLKPNDAKIMALLGLAYFRLGAYAEARDVYGKLIQKQPKDAALRLNLGLVFLKLGNADEAIAELDRARELDPGQQRTVGYLALAYARKGQFAKAREMFLAAGQEDLAREMEQQLAQEGAGAGGGGAVAAPVAGGTPPEGVPARDATAPAGGDDNIAIGEEDGVVVDSAPEAVPSPVVEVAPAAPESARETAAREAAAPRPADGEGEITRAVRLAVPAVGVVAAPLATDGHRAPQSVTEFATERLIRPDDGALAFELAAGGTLIVRVQGRVLSRTEGVVVSGGELGYEPATRRSRGRITDEPFGSAARPMFFVTGHGHLVATPGGGTFAALQLADDIVYLREELVFAFEERLGWENGHVPGSNGGIPVVQFRGEGCLALRTRKPMLTVKLAPDRTLYVDAALLAGWIGRVVPRVVAPAAGGEASAPFVECTGEGVLLVEEPAEPQEG